MSIASRTIFKRGANVSVLAYGQALFAPGTEVSRWKNRFSQRILAGTIAAAPTNQRPRWAHYGKPLKTTFTANTRTRITHGGGFFYVAVGSTSPHAYYVDQGTGIYAGSSAYPAKILPPWQHGGASLYEHTWKPGGPQGRTVPPVMIRGQKPQGFFDKGLRRGFESMRLRSFQVPGEGVSGLASGMATFPEGLANFVGNTPADAGFIAQLEEWRAWRDRAFAKHEGLGRGGGIGSRAHVRALTKNRRPRPNKPKPPSRPSDAQIHAMLLQAIQRERTALLHQARAKYVGDKVTVSGRLKHDGVYSFKVTVTRNGRSVEFWVPSNYQAALSL